MQKNSPKTCIISGLEIHSPGSMNDENVDGAFTELGPVHQKEFDRYKGVMQDARTGVRAVLKGLPRGFNHCLNESPLARKLARSVIEGECSMQDGIENLRIRLEEEGERKAKQQ